MASESPVSGESPASLSDDELLRRLSDLLRQGRRVEADLIAHIAEVDERRLYLRESCSSMFLYCVERLHLSEPQTALRIVVARASRRHPVLLRMLRDGRLHLSGIALLAPHLTEQNRDEVLLHARHLSKRQIEELVARLAPRPDVPTLIRKLPGRRNEATHLQGTTRLEHRLDDVAGEARSGRLSGRGVAGDGVEPPATRAEPPTEAETPNEPSPAPPVLRC